MAATTTAYYWLRTGRVVGVYTDEGMAHFWAAKRGGVVRTVETASVDELAVIEAYKVEQKRLFAS